MATRPQDAGAPSLIPRPTPSASTETPSAAPRAFSPGEMSYLRNQARNILIHGGSEEDVVNFTQTHAGLPLEARIRSMREGMTETGGDGVTEDNLISGLSMNAIQGVTFGFGDEALGSLLGVLTGEGAAGGREAYRERLQAWNAANPKKAFGAEMLGGFLTGAGTARAVGLGAKAASNAARFGMVAAEGAAGGALAGAGNASGDISDRTKAALFGAAGGAVLGPAFVAAARIGGAAARPATRAVLDRVKGLQDRIPGLGSAGQHAQHFILETLEAEDLSVQDLRAGALALRRNGVNPTLADVGGQGTLGLLSETLGSRTVAKQKLAEQIMSRQAEQGARLSGGLFRQIMRSTNLGLRNAYDAVDDLALARSRQAAPLYEEAYQQAIPTNGRLKEILSNPKFRAAWEEGRRIAETEKLAGVRDGLDIPDLPATSLRQAAEQQLTDMGVTGARLDEMLAQLPDAFPDELPVRGLDYMKRGLDAIIARGLKNGSVTDKQELRALRALREEVLEMADEAVPSFAQARAVWGDMSQAMEAIEAGQKFLQLAPPLVARELDTLIKKSPGLADFYRLGAAQSIYENVTGAASRSEGADIAKRFFGGRLFGGQNQDALRIQALFPDAPDVAQDFMRQVAAEARISATTRAARTPRGGRALQEFEEGVEGSVPNVRMTPTLTILGAIQQGITKAQGFFKREVSDEVASLFSRGMDDPAEFDLLLDALEQADIRRLARRRFGREAEAGLASALGLISGRITGSAN